MIFDNFCLWRGLLRLAPGSRDLTSQLPQGEG